MPRPAVAAPAPGDRVPAIVVSQWISAVPPIRPGQPGADKYVFVVEFWATWCGPCKLTIPHLARLHDRLHDKGVLIISLSNEESETVRKFVEKQKRQKDGMPYAVGVFDFDSETSKWMDGINGIPYAFVVDRRGVVVWSGHPLENLDQVVEQVLAERFDVEKEKRRAAGARQAKDIMRQLQAAYSQDQREKALELSGRLIALDPVQLQPHMIHRQLLRELRRPESELAEATRKLEEAITASPLALAQLAQIEMSNPDLGNRDPALALRSIRRAVELTQHKDADALQALARVECELGMIDAAIETQRRAEQLLDGESRKAAERILRYYKKARRLSSEASGKPKTR